MHSHIHYHPLTPSFTQKVKQIKYPNNEKKIQAWPQHLGSARIYSRGVVGNMSMYKYHRPSW